MPNIHYAKILSIAAPAIIFDNPTMEEPIAFQIFPLNDLSDQDNDNF